MTKLSSLVVMLLIAPFFSAAQFLVTYSDPSSSDVAFSAVTKYGSNFLAFGNQGNDIIAVEVTSSGTVVSSKTITLIDNLKTPVCFSVITDNDGIQVISGFRGIVGDVTTYSAFIMRYDYSGNDVLWAKSLQVSGAFGSTFDKVIESTPGGNYLVCGYTTHPGSNQEGILCRVNRNNGNIQVLADLNLNNSAEGFSSFIKDSHRIYTVGRYNLGGGGFDLMRSCMSILSSAGDEISSSAYIRNSNTTARMYGTDLTFLGNYIYTITTGDGGGTGLNKDEYLCKISRNGNLQFTKKLDFTASSSDGKMQSIKTFSSGLIVYGNKYDATGQNTLGNAFLLGLNGIGDVIWAKSYPFTFHQVGAGVGAMLVSGNSIIAVGRQLNTSTNHYAGCIISVSASSGDLFSCDVNEAVSSITESPVQVSLDLTSIVNDDIVASSSSAVDTEQGLTSFECLALGKESTEPSFASSELYLDPNPAKDQVTLKFPANDNQQFDCFVYSADGRMMVHQVITGEKFNLDISSFQQGIYFIALREINENHTYQGSFLKE